MIASNDNLRPFADNDNIRVQFILSASLVTRPSDGDEWLQYDFEQALIQKLKLVPIDKERANRDFGLRLPDRFRFFGNFTVHAKEAPTAYSSQYPTLFLDTVDAATALLTYFLKVVRVRIVNDLGSVERKKNLNDEILVAPRFRLTEKPDCAHIIPTDLLPSRVLSPTETAPSPRVIRPLKQAKIRAANRNVPLFFAYIRGDDDKILTRVKSLARYTELLISTGPRTASDFNKDFRQRIKDGAMPLDLRQVYFYSRATTPRSNPYVQWLRAADAVVMSGDTMSGISDAAAAGKMTTLLNPSSGRSNKAFQQPLLEAGIVKQWTRASAVAKNVKMPREKNLLGFDQAITELVTRIYSIAEKESAFFKNPPFHLPKTACG